MTFLLRGVAGKLARAAQGLELGARRAAFDQWQRDCGDQRHRLDYSLSKNSVVWDVGAYQGQWTSDIFGRFSCRVHAFEPLPTHYEYLHRRFKVNSSVSIHSFGLGKIDATLPLYADGDASSLLRGSLNRFAATMVRVREIGAVLREFGDSEIGLLKLNIEGAEYELLDYIIESGLTHWFTNIQVQFHDFVPAAARRRNDLATKLQRTHMRTWCYPFVWENWRVRS